MARTAIGVVIFAIAASALVSVAIAGISPVAPMDAGQAAAVTALAKRDATLAKQSCLNRRHKWLNREFGGAPASLPGVIAANGFARATCLFQ